MPVFYFLTSKFRSVNDIGDTNHCGMHPLQIPAFVQVMLSQNIKEHYSHKDRHLTADLQATKMKHRLQGHTALHKERVKYSTRIHLILKHIRMATTTNMATVRKLEVTKSRQKVIVHLS